MKLLISKYWFFWITQRRKLVPTILLMPSLYFIGWLIVKPVSVLQIEIINQNISLIGTLISFLLFFALLPGWVKLRWNSSFPFRDIGLFDLNKLSSLAAFLNGIFLAVVLLLCLTLPLIIWSYAGWVGNISFFNIINSLFLLLLVGFAEELIFRGWLLGELNVLINPRFVLVGQALIFSFAHIRFGNLSWDLIPELCGLFLLGLVLALTRKIQKGSILTCIGLHGGLVGGWFLITNSLIQIDLSTPAWLIGPGGASGNPLGGGVGICALLFILWRQLTALAIAGMPLTGARKASSRDAIP